MTLTPDSKVILAICNLVRFILHNHIAICEHPPSKNERGIRVASRKTDYITCDLMKHWNLISVFFLFKMVVLDMLFVRTIDIP